MMKDLRAMYQQTLKQLGASKEQVDRVNVTRLKNNILTEVSGLCEQKKGKYVFLTLDGVMGKALFEASCNSTTDEGIIICKAASIIRKHMFITDESFDDDLSTIRQKSSVPPHLLHLIGLILEGAND